MQRRLTRFHFVGIGGIGMAALAELLHAEGCHVTGTDVVEGATVGRLRDLGVEVWIGHDAARVRGAEA
ncbi:MAG TPA: Mur ligase domain-containing protein, partial [Myxococcota bacterium]|nr:Mur ligase domain-containing protein [Myxococcota bacterium]